MTSVGRRAARPDCKPDGRHARLRRRRRSPPDVCRPLAVAGDPLADITELERVTWVMKAGTGDRAVAVFRRTTRTRPDLHSPHETDLGWIDRGGVGDRDRDATRRRAKSSRVVALRAARGSRSSSPDRRPPQTAGYAPCEPGGASADRSRGARRIRQAARAPAVGAAVGAGDGVGQPRPDRRAEASSTTSRSTASTRVGRTAIVVDPRDANVVYLATSGGGVWKTFNFLASGGPTWAPTTDTLPNLAVGALAIDADSSRHAVRRQRRLRRRLGQHDPQDARRRRHVERAGRCSTGMYSPGGFAVDVGVDPPDRASRATSCSPRPTPACSASTMPARRSRSSICPNGTARRARRVGVERRAGRRWRVGRQRACTACATGLQLPPVVDFGSAIRCASARSATTPRSGAPTTARPGRRSPRLPRAARHRAHDARGRPDDDPATTRGLRVRRRHRRLPRPSATGARRTAARPTSTRPARSRTRRSRRTWTTSCTDIDTGHGQTWYNQAIVVDPTNPDHVLVGGNLCGMRTLNGTAAAPTWELVCALAAGPGLRRDRERPARATSTPTGTPRRRSPSTAGSRRSPAPTAASSRATNLWSTGTAAEQVVWTHRNKRPRDAPALLGRFRRSGAGDPFVAVHAASRTTARGSAPTRTTRRRSTSRSAAMASARRSTTRRRRHDVLGIRRVLSRRSASRPRLTAATELPMAPDDASSHWHSVANPALP